jgi:hypothetical protein
VLIASAQKHLGVLCSSIIILAISTRVLINTMLKAKLIKRGIPERCPIVTKNRFEAVGMLIVQPQRQALKVLKHFILTIQEKKPKSNENSHQQ